MSLADELLADLEDFSEEEDVALENEEENEMGEGGDEPQGFDDLEEKMDLDGIDTNSGPREVAKLLGSRDFQHTLTEIEQYMGTTRSSVLGPVEEDPEYKLIVKVNKLTVDIDGEINVLHKYVRDLYVKRFPELEQLIMNPIDYLKTVAMIGNDMDVTKLDLASILPGPTVMVVTVSASNSHGQDLDAAELAHITQACDMAFELGAALEKMLKYVESRMAFIAPNLTHIVGAATAAKLMGVAGGLNALSKMPSCNVQVCGRHPQACAVHRTAPRGPK
jgi:U4/U6 small nuclear ribonucleoprotein PRP31